MASFSVQTPQRGCSGLNNYSMINATLEQFSRSVALEEVVKGVRVVNVKTGGLQEAGRDPEIGRLFTFLASEDNPIMSGTVVVTDGGGRV